MNDPYSTGRMTNLAVGYFLSERYGMEFSYEQGNLVDNEGTSSYLRDFNGVSPDYNKFRSTKNLSFIFVPLYAKMSFLDRAILYFDMQFAAGVGLLEYGKQRQEGEEVASTPNFHFDITQQIFFHEHIAIRLDLKNKWSKQERTRFKISPDRNLPTIQNLDTTILFGLTYFY